MLNLLKKLAVVGLVCLSQESCRTIPSPIDTEAKYILRNREMLCEKGAEIDVKQNEIQIIIIYGNRKAIIRYLDQDQNGRFEKMQRQIVPYTPANLQLEIKTRI